MYRVGDEKREMSPDYLARLQTRIIRFDEQPVPDTTLDDLTPALWQRFATSRTRDSREALLHKLGMATREEGEMRPSVAGVLMACENPSRWLPHAFIQAVAYRGTQARPDADPLYQLDAADIDGPLDRQILNACHFVRKNMRVGASKTVGRSDHPQYDMTAVFEAIVNAVAHRDYAMHGAKIRLQMFSNRLELYSPGAIPNTMTVESLSYRQAARNEALTSLLAKCEIPEDADFAMHRSTIMDKRGEGVSIVLDNSERVSGRRPDYRMLDASELYLVIYAAPETLDTA